MSVSHLTRRRTWLVLAPLLFSLAACGESDGGGSAAAPEDQAGNPGDTIRLGYSAWPGWFPWAVTEEKGFFDEAGVDVELVYFNDYLGSLDAMAAGQLDLNGQTLNDTLVSVSAGSDQRVALINDNSAGNDAIIVDESINTIEDLRGKVVAAELGIVDHFLLLQGLQEAGISEEEIEFRSVSTDAAAAAFAGGEFDAVGVFAPFTLQALERTGSKVLFDSNDFPGTIPDLMAVTSEMVNERSDEMQLIVDAWYRTLEWIEANPEDALEIVSEAADLSTEEYASFQDGTRIFSADEALESFEADTLPEGIQPMAEEVNAFLVETGLAEVPASLDELFLPEFTMSYLERNDG